ncbi:MAG: hypothetical protein NZ580_00750 [Bacteroidia bacterium]|nr:hypothetical protein [Bacteroidia bacterium]MDW8235223.1 hypothetical protein [Bacteroidia bacterium]
MGKALILWLQFGSFPFAYREDVQEIRLFPDYGEGVWIGCRTLRQTRSGVFIYYVDAVGNWLFGKAGICLSCRDSASVIRWDAVAGEKNLLYAVRQTRHTIRLSAIERTGKLHWEHTLPAEEGEFRLLAHPSGGILLLQASEKQLSLKSWDKQGALRYNVDGIVSERMKRHPLLLSVNLEGFFLLWEEFDGTKWQAVLQKWSWEGKALAAPTPLSGFAHSVERAQFISDGFGGVLGVYEATSLYGAGKDLHFVRYSRSGQRIVETPICTEAGDQQNPRLYKRGTELLVTWEDNRQQDWDIYFQRLDIRTGQALLPNQGTPLVRLPGVQESPELLLDYFQNESIVAWVDYRHLQGDLYMQRVSAEGKPLWEFAGRPLVANPYQQKKLQSAPHDLRHFWIAYAEEHPYEGTHAWVILLSVEGKELFRRRLGGNTQTSTPTIGEITCQPWKEGKLVVWTEDRDSAGLFQLYAQYLKAKGEPQWLPMGLPLAPQPQLHQKEPLLATRGDTAWILWKGEESEVESDLFAQAITVEGNRLFLPNPLPVCIADRVQHEARWLSSSSALYAYWSDSRSMEETGFDLYLRKIVPLAPEQGWQTRLGFQNTSYLLSAKAEYYHHFWQEEEGRRYRIFYGRGRVGEPYPVQALIPNGGAQRFLHAEVHPQGYAYAAFCEESPGPYQQAVHCWVIDPEGRVAAHFRSPLGHTHHLYPRVFLLSDQEVAFTAIAQSKTGSWELLYLTVSPSGELREKGILLSPIPEKCQWHLLKDASGYWLFLQAGDTLWVYTGERLSALHSQTRPFITPKAYPILYEGRAHLFLWDKSQHHWQLLPLSRQ